jgi:hypothetical protein
MADDKKRQCGKPTKAGGKCKNPPVKGKQHCVGHLSRKEKEALGFGGPQEGSGRPRKLRPSDVSRRLLEENVAAVLGPYWRTLGYDLCEGPDGQLHLEACKKGGAKVTATFEGEVSVSDVDDLGAQIAAAEKLQDRVFGRPRQEITGADGAPLQLEVTGAAIVSDPDARKHAAELRRRVGSARSQQPGRSRTSH